MAPSLKTHVIPPCAVRKHFSAAWRPIRVASLLATVAVGMAELHRLFAPAMSSPVASVVGFTGRADDGRLYNSAAFLADGEFSRHIPQGASGYGTAMCTGVKRDLMKNVAAEHIQSTV